MRAFAPVAFSLLTLGFSACTPAPADRTAEAADTGAVAAEAARAPDVEPIRGLVDRFLTAWNSSDTTALASMVTDDVILLQPDGPVLQGRDAILEFIAGSYDPTLLQQTATVDELAALGPQYAYGRGSWSVEPTGEAGPDVEGGNGKWSTIYRLGADGQWRMWRWMWNQPSPADSATATGAAATTNAG